MLFHNDRCVIEVFIGLFHKRLLERVENTRFVDIGDPCEMSLRFKSGTLLRFDVILNPLNTDLFLFLDHFPDRFEDFRSKASLLCE